MGVGSSSSADGSSSRPAASPAGGAAVVDLTAEVIDAVPRRQPTDDDYIQEIHRLEAEHRAVLDELSAKRKELSSRHDMYANELADADVTIATQMSKEEEDIKLAYQNELQDIKNMKQKEFENLISELNNIIFPEARLFAIEDIRSRAVQEFEETWKAESTRLINENDNHLTQALLIAEDEHGRVIMQHQNRFAEEKRILEEEIQETRSASGGMFGFGWFVSPGGTRKKKSREEESDEDYDEDECASSKMKRSRK